MIKVAFIGAGSVEFTRNVVTDLCSYPELNGRLHFALHDISAERLSWADRLARCLVAARGALRKDPAHLFPPQYGATAEGRD